MQPDEGSLNAVRSQATEIARGWSPPGAPASWALTAAIFTALGHDEELVALGGEVPPDRLPALLLCAAACDLVGQEQPPGLASYFPRPGEPQPELDAAFGPAFRDFCLARRGELLDLCHHRRYQMNEVARTTQVALALSVVAERFPSTDIALIDLGTGAGLGLHVDRYRHELGADQALGDLESSLVLRCDAGTSVPANKPRSLPTIGWRVGIDLDPLDLSDPGDRRWALSCIPPEASALERFDHAAHIALAHPTPILAGDAVELLSSVLDTVPDHLLPVVTDTYTAVFFSDEQRARLHDVLGRRGATRDLAWISLDPLVPLGTAGRHSVQALDVTDDLVADYQHNGVFALLGMVSFEQGRSTGQVLARAHPSGTTMTWMAG